MIENADVYTQANQRLREESRPLYSAQMQWAEIRAAYERLFIEAKRRGETQQTIAARGGIHQNQISKMLNNDKLGPQAETLARAVEGLGLTVSSFFLQIERQTTGDSTRPLEVGKDSTPPQPARGQRGDDPATAVSSDLARFIGKALVDAGNAVTTAAAGGKIEQLDRPVPRARRQKPAPRKRRA